MDFREERSVLEEVLDGHLSPSIDPERRKAGLTEVLKPFTDADGPWRFAPKSAKTNAVRRYTAEQDRIAAEALFEVESVLMRTAEIDQAIERTKRPRDPAAVSNGHDPTMHKMLVEMYRQRLSRLGKAQPSERLGAYEEASARVRETEEEGTEPDAIDLTLIEIIETTKGASTADERELLAQQTLSTRAVNRARQIFKIRPQPREDED